MSEQTTSVTGQGGSRPIDPKARIGHVHLKVADLDRALAFYCGVLGFELTQRYGEQAAFVVNRRVISCHLNLLVLRPGLVQAAGEEGWGWRKRHAG